MFPQLDARALAMQPPSALMGDSRLITEGKTETRMQALDVVYLETGSHCHSMWFFSALGAPAVTLLKFYIHIW